MSNINFQVNFSTQNNISENEKKIFNSISKLSSGKKIDNSGNGTAFMAMSERLSSLIGGVSHAIENIESAVSVMQTVDAGLESIEDTLVDMKALAVKAGNTGVLDDSSMDAINNQFRESIDFIDETVDSTTFNNKNLIDGTFDESFQTGAAAGENIDIKISNMHSQNLAVNDEGTFSSLATIELHDSGDASEAVKLIDDAISQVSGQRAQIGSFVKNNLQSELNRNLLTLENLIGTKSQISDTDVAEESAKLLEARALLQTGIFSQAHSNIISSNILSLLG
jgi:flagellin